MTRLEEQEKIARLKAGDHQVFELLVKELQNRVYNTCLGLLQNEQDAEDVTQEVFISVFQSIHSFKGESRLSTWVYRIAVTRSLELIRSKKRKKRFAFLRSLIGSDDDLAGAEAIHFHHPGVELENKERAAILFSAIERLPENQKTAFVLHKVEQLSQAEIADIMKLSVSSVESLMVRARQNLRKLLEAYYEKNER